MGDSTDRELLSAADVGRTISRIAHQIIEKTALDAADAPRVVLLGIPTRGVTLAARIAEKVKEFSDVELPYGALDITLYRDDLNFKPPRALASTSIPPSGRSAMIWRMRVLPPIRRRKLAGTCGTMLG